MNTFWLKIAGLTLIVAVVVVLVGNFISSEKSPPAEEPKVQPEAKQKTFYDQVEEDKKKFSTEPQAVKDKDQRLKRPEKIDVPVEPPNVRKQRKQKQSEENQTAKPEKPSEEPITLYFKPISEIEEIEARKLLNVAVPGRSIGRLPMAGFQLMVNSCREIIRKWPDSWYAYRAKQMLADMPTRFRQRYNITEEELDISEFTKPRPGTEPLTIKDSR